MLHWYIFTLVFQCCFIGSYSTVGHFAGHKVVQITAKTDNDLHVLASFLHNQTHIDVWHYPSTIHRVFDVRLSPGDFKSITASLDSSRYTINTLIDDLQVLVDRERKDRERQTSSNGPMDFHTKYRKLDEIHKQLNKMVKENAKIASTFEVTKSFEKRPLLGIKISATSEKKPAFWIQGGIHAREWISPATVMYMTDMMLKDPEIAKTVALYDWYILPVMNPDGYKYTWSGKKEARLWRKTRSVNKDSKCKGVDPNRNWDFKWGEINANKSACSEVYVGPSAFSEVEVKGVAEFVKNIKPKAFIDFHSYSQLWMSPWAYTNDIPKDYNAQDKGSQIAVKAIGEYNFKTMYRHGRTSNILPQLYSGIGSDWAYGNASIKYSYAVELRPKIGDESTFLLPDTQIIPSGEETLQALMALAKYIHDN